MSQEKNKLECGRWLKQAKADLKAAAGSLKNESNEWACFQAEQAGEKALKAVWYFHNLDPWGHSLVKLIKGFPNRAVQTRLVTLLQEAKELDKLYIPTRYPNGLPDLIPADVFTSAEARRAISSARKIIDLAVRVAK